MAARRINLVNAAIEVAFVLGALVLGYARSPFWGVFALALIMMAYWALNRRHQLAQLKDRSFATLARAFAVSVAAIALVLAAAYGIGWIIPRNVS